MRPRYLCRLLCLLLVSGASSIALMGQIPTAEKEQAPMILLKVQGDLLAVDRVHPQLKMRFKTHIFKMSAGKVYVIDLTSGAFDTYLRIDASDGNSLATDDDGGAGTNSRLFFHPKRDDDYRLIVASFDKKVGPYVLSIRQASAEDSLAQEAWDWRAKSFPLFQAGNVLAAKEA